MDREFRVSGKLVYELNWIKGSPNGNYITYEQVVNAKSSSRGKEAVLVQQIKTEKEKKYVRPEGEDEDCGSGICACFAVRKKKKTETPRQIQEAPRINQRVERARV